jgi:peptide/nickel transport system substrate-binding protein
LKKARALLEKAGYPDGFSFDLWAYRQRKVAEAIMADLAKVGITARLRYVKTGTLGRARASREVESYFASWASGGTADTSMIVGPHWVLDSSRNLSGDAAVSETVLAAERTLDPEKRKAAFKTALTRIAEQAYWAPLYAGTLHYLVGADVDFTPPRDGLPRLFLTKWK